MRYFEYAVVVDGYRVAKFGGEGDAAIFRKLASQVGNLGGLSSQFRFDPARDGALIVRYREQFNTGMAMAQLDFAPTRIAKHLTRIAE